MKYDELHSSFSQYPNKQFDARARSQLGPAIAQLIENALLNGRGAWGEVRSRVGQPLPPAPATTGRFDLAGLRANILFDEDIAGPAGQLFADLIMEDGRREYMPWIIEAARLCFGSFGTAQSDFFTPLHDLPFSEAKDQEYAHTLARQILSPSTRPDAVNPEFSAQAQRILARFDWAWAEAILRILGKSNAAQLNFVVEQLQTPLVHAYRRDSRLVDLRELLEVEHPAMAMLCMLAAASRGVRLTMDSDLFAKFIRFDPCNFGLNTIALDYRVLTGAPMKFSKETAAMLEKHRLLCLRSNFRSHEVRERYSRAVLNLLKDAARPSRRELFFRDDGVIESDSELVDEIFHFHGKWTHVFLINSIVLANRGGPNHDLFHLVFADADSRGLKAARVPMGLPAHSPPWERTAAIRGIAKNSVVFVSIDSRIDMGGHGPSYLFAYNVDLDQWHHYRPKKNYEEDGYDAREYDQIMMSQTPLPDPADMKSFYGPDVDELLENRFQESFRLPEIAHSMKFHTRT